MSQFKDYYKNNIHLHTQHVDINFSPTVLKYTQLQCNNDTIQYTNMPEVAKIEDLLQDASPKNILEIGGGVGRSSVYMKKRYGWDDSHFYMLDGNTGDRQIAPVDGKGTKDFYNSHEATSTFCSENNLTNYTLLDAETDEWKNTTKGIKFDLIYSFLSVGFHWDINLYLSTLVNYCLPSTKLIFGMRGTDRGNEFAEQQIHSIENSKYRIVRNVRRSEKERSSVLVLELDEK